MPFLNLVHALLPLSNNRSLASVVPKIREMTFDEDNLCWVLLTRVACNTSDDVYTIYQLLSLTKSATKARNKRLSKLSGGVSTLTLPRILSVLLGKGAFV